MNKTITSAIVIAIIVGSSSFYAGTKYQQSKAGNQPNLQNFQNMTDEQRQQAFGQLGANAGNFIARSGNSQRHGENFSSGEIISKDDKSITVKLADSGSKIIFFSEDSTEISKFVEGSDSDLEVGKTISASGAQNSDGSLTAQTIQLRSQLQTPPSQSN